MTTRPDGVMHDQHAEIIALRQDPYPIAAGVDQAAYREVMKRVVSLGASLNAYDWKPDQPTGLDVRTAALAVLFDAEQPAAASVDPYAYLGSVASGVLRAIRECKAEPRD